MNPCHCQSVSLSAALLQPGNAIAFPHPCIFEKNSNDKELAQDSLPDDLSGHAKGSKQGIDRKLSLQGGPTSR